MVVYECSTVAGLAQPGLAGPGPRPCTPCCSMQLEGMPSVNKGVRMVALHCEASKAHVRN